MAGTWRMFRAMLWKNMLLKKRHFIMTVIEILFPCSVFILLLYVHVKLEQMKFFDDIRPDQYSEPNDDAYFSNCIKGNFNLVFSPNNSYTQKIMEKVNKSIQEQQNPFDIHRPDHQLPGSPPRPRPNGTIVGLNNKKEVIDYLANLRVKSDTMFTDFEAARGQQYDWGIVFTTDKDSQKKLKYTIYTYMNIKKDSFPEELQDGPMYSNENYLTFCFIVVQRALDSAFIEIVLGKDKLPYSVYVQSFPYPSFESDSFTGGVMSAANIALIGSFTFSVIIIITGIVNEKRSGGKELLKINGISGWMIWFGWLLYANITIIIISIFITVLFGQHFVSAAIISYSNKFLFWLTLFLFYNVVVIFIFIICAWFSNPLLAIFFGMAVYSLSWGLSIAFSEPSGSRFKAILQCLVPTLASSKAMHIFQQSERFAEGVTFRNLFRCTFSTCEISLGLILIMFIFDMIIYSVIVWYIDNVRPGRFGVAKPWNFICKSCFSKDVDIEEITERSEFFEDQIGNLQVGIAIRNVRKVFPNGVEALKNINFDIYQGVITALLGHNGAGKTTLMSIITGLCSPSKGNVFCYTSDSSYYNVFNEMHQFRKHLGLCPQENLHFTYFTVIEHLVFFGFIKGLSKKVAKENGIFLLETMQMKSKMNARVNKLSGGMKRKLALAIALVAKPSVLILDEPTSGMDPESRREIWDVLLEIRESRTVILTTHYMEEAEVLGNRIAIMEHGRVSCYGTPMFLKSIFGSGYHLTILLDQNANVDIITKIVTSVTPGSKLERYNNQQLIYILPIDKKSTFPALFSALEDNSRGILSIGVSFATLEEVFLRVGKLAEIEAKKKFIKESPAKNQRKWIKPPSFDKRQSSSSTNPEAIIEEALQSSSFETITSSAYDRYEGCRLCWKQFCALLWKKLLYNRRKFISTILFGLFSLLMAAFTIYFVSSLLVKKLEQVFLTYTLDMYRSSKVFVGYNEEAGDYVDAYNTLIKGSTVKLVENTSTVNALLESGRKDLTAYRLHHIVAADWGLKYQQTVIALFSTIANHAPVISLNLVMNALLKNFNNDMSIEISAATLQRKEEMANCGPFLTNISMMIWNVIFPMGITGLIASFISYPFDERITGLKHLQLMTGVSPIVYWAAIYIIDSLIFIFFVLLLPIPFFIVENMKHVHIYFKFKEMGVLLTIVILFGLSSLPYAYVFSNFAKTFAGSVTAFILVTVIIVAAGEVSKIIFIIKNVEKTSIYYLIVTIFFQLNPFYCFIDAINIYNKIIFDNGRCTFCKSIITKGCENSTERPYFVFNKVMGSGLNYFLCFMALDAVIYFILLLLIDYGLFNLVFHLLNKICLGYPDYGPDPDHDVAQQEMLVANLTDNPSGTHYIRQNYSLIVDALVKKYEAKYTAVKGVSFVVEKGECFGLLGVNGAGKSTLFAMLTGVVRPTYGNAYIDDYNLWKNKTSYLSQIGYCPQYDAICHEMTGFEMVKLFGYLRGLTKSENQLAANFWITLLGLKEFKDRQCGTYSGGNKRKLSVAMTLIGEPDIVFLDEPTSGVDPISRRKLWRVLDISKNTGQSIVLTTHSMEECEVLCKRITIMVKGQMKCIGTIQYLKNKFSQGYTIQLNLTLVEDYEEQLSDVKITMEHVFRGNCDLKDEHKGFLHYHITKVTLTWSYLFKKMEDMKNRLQIIEDYSINQTTLEQLFLSFAREEV